MTGAVWLVMFCYRGAQKRSARRVGEIASRSTQYLPGAIGHRAAVSEHREPFAGGAGDAAGPNSSATHPASVRTAISGIKQMLYGNFYRKRLRTIDLPKCLWGRKSTLRVARHTPLRLNTSSVRPPASVRRVPQVLVTVRVSSGRLCLIATASCWLRLCVRALRGTGTSPRGS